MVLLARLMLAVEALWLVFGLVWWHTGIYAQRHSDIGVALLSIFWFWYWVLGELIFGALAIIAAAYLVWRFRRGD